MKVDDNDEPLGVIDGVLNYDTERAVISEQGTISLANSWATAITGWFVWFIIAAMNVATLTFLGLGIGGD